MFRSWTLGRLYVSLGWYVDEWTARFVRIPPPRRPFGFYVEFGPLALGVLWG